MKTAVLLVMLAGLAWAGPLSPRDPARTNDALLLERLTEEFQRKKDRRERDEPWQKQTLIRPRGSSLDGQFMLFEKRTYGDHLEFAFLLFDTVSNTRREYQLANYQVRSKALVDASSSGLPIPASAFEYRLETANVGLTSEFESLTRALYRFEVDRLRDRARFRIWLSKPGDVSNAMDENHAVRKRLLADYSVLGAGVTGASVPEIYSFRDGRCIAVKIHVVRTTMGNLPEIYQDILCFDETQVMKQSNTVLWRTTGYSLTPSQQTIVFLQHRSFDWQGRLLGGWDHRLSGVAIPVLPPELGAFRQP